MMISVARVLKGAAGAVLLALSAAAQAFTAPNFTAPGVPSPGYPDFWGANTEASLSRNGGSGTYTLSVTGNDAACDSQKSLSSCSAALFNFPSAAYLVSNESLSITAIFTANGQFVSGTYSIAGSLPASSSPTFGSAPAGYGWASQPTETLLSANLTSDAVDSANEALGFTATFTGGWADQPLFTGGITSESVWLYSLLSGLGEASGANTRNSTWNAFLAQLKSGSQLKPGTFAGIASIATVALPGAVFLLASGLAGLGVMLRRRSIGSLRPAVHAVVARTPCPCR